MDHFLYRDGELFAEDVPVAEIAEEVGTPFYCYSTATLTRHFHLFDEALDGTDHMVCYAVKAASNQAILKTLAGLGAGMDVVSGGEYARARAAGVPAIGVITVNTPSSLLMTIPKPPKCPRVWSVRSS